MGNKLFSVIVGVLVVGVIGLLIFAGGDDAATELTREDVIAVDDTDNYKGADPQEAEVVMVEYFDFACGACASIYPITDQVITEYEDRPVTFVARNFSFLGGSSAVAHRAAEAAGLQDKYFEMAELLFTQQAVWRSTNDPNAIFTGYAEQLELDIDQFTADLNSAEVGELITSDKSRATVLGVEATPTFFLNGEQIENTPRSVEGFMELIDAELEASSNNSTTDDSVAETE